MTHPVTGFLNGLMGGVEAGTEFRYRRDDRRRQMATEDDAAQYERARRIREGVAFELSQKVGQSQLETQAATRDNLTADNDRADRAAGVQAYQTLFPAEKPFTMDWQKEGFPDQPSWMRYHERISRSGGSGGTGKVADEKLQFGIAGGIEAIRGMKALLAKDPDANVTPVGSKMAEGLSHLPIVGGAFAGMAESASQQAMTPNQQEYANYVESLAHNIAGLLPNKGLAIFKSLRDVYKSQAGSSPEARAAKAALLDKLERRLVQLQNGEKVTESDIVGDIEGTSAGSGTADYLNTPPARGVNRYDPNGRNPLPSDAVPSGRPAVNPSKFFRP